MSRDFRVRARDKKLQKARERFGESQRSMADLLSLELGVTVGEKLYQKWEHGTRTVPLAPARTIARILDKPVSELFISAENGVAFGKDLK